MSTLMLFGHAVTYSRTKQLIDLARQRHNGEPYVVAPQAKMSFLAKQSYVLYHLLRCRLTLRGISQIYVGFYGYIIIFFAKLFFPRASIYFDAYVSNYEVMVDEPEKWHLLGKRFGNFMAWLMKLNNARFLYALDYLALQLAELILIDTKTHKAYLVETFKLPQDQIEVLYILPDLKNFKPKELEPADEKFKVFFHGSNQVIHNADLIVESAKLLEDISDLEIIIAGPFDEYIDRHSPTPNIKHYPWIPHDEIPNYLDRCHLCLGGHFTTIPRAGRVIPGKTIQYLAMDTPTIVQDNPANRELLSEDILDFDQSNLIFRDIKTPEDLAKAIRERYTVYKSNEDTPIC